MPYELSVRDYLSILRRRMWILIVPFVLVTALGALVAYALPAQFESQGTILIESQQIPEDLVRSTVTGLANERVRITQQRVMTRENLSDIIREFDLYNEDGLQRSQTEKVERLRNRISMDMIEAGSSRNRSTIAFSVGYRDEAPNRALRVTSELVTLFLNENVRTRTQRATETTEFLRGQADDLQQELEEIEARLTTYRRENAGALPEQLGLHLDMLERARQQLRDVETELKSYEGEIRFLSIEEQAVRDRRIVSPTAAEIPTTPEQQLDAMERQLASLKIRYSEQHPDVRSLQQQIEALRASIETSAANPTTSESPSDSNEVTVSAVESTTDPTLARIETSIGILESRIASQNEFREQLLRQIADLEARVSLTPDVELGLRNLSRDLENTRQKYEELRAKEQSAQLSQSLEEDRKAERFILLEPPVLPEEPSSPNRLLIAAAGPFLGLGIGAGLLILVELLFGRVTRPVVLAGLMGEPPLAILPKTESQADVRRKRFQYAVIGGVGLAGLIVILATHFLVMPLNDLLNSAISLIA